ncbi:S41 family peptidase [Clostridium manihotivorum]|uniref:Tail specific protease domain-containing protein n=1 Tax=Clostridium manihotivorum TaxID=2320868 RepID=A0A410DTQ3_9CLOT|nr:S41 family peptidase [Clostridium manihotivorum]QAA32439.1 hypothetical protein C1I91_12755 [Clostridium manihotivorum]
MNYLEIFDDIASIMRTDYSGCNDKKDWDAPEIFRNQLISLEKDNNLDAITFKEIVSDYLLDFKDGHVSLTLSGNNSPKAYDNGFKCRRHKDKLYITHVGKEKRLEKGMAIVAMDDISITELGTTYKKNIQVLGSHADRENWSSVLLKHKQCVVETKSGEAFEMILEKYEKEKYIPEYSIKPIGNDTLLIKLTDFNDDDISKLIEDNRAALDTAKYLIIDVRVNYGGSDSAYMKLLDYIFPREISFNQLHIDVTQYNMTERNYTLRTTQLKQYLTQVEDQNTKKVIKDYLDTMDKYRNKGFVEFDINDSVPNVKINGRKSPEKVVVLQDVYCGSSGDSFVVIAGQSEKVTLIGRGTAGITDYSNVAVQQYENGLMLWYPTSRDAGIDNGKGLTGVGATPDIYIPWSPEHIEKDIDLEKAIEFLSK